MESPVPSPAGMRVPPVFEPSQAFLFGSLDFVADRLSVLRLRKETRDPAPVGEMSSIDSGTRDLNGAASALHFEQTLCLNPAVSNIHAVLYLLHSIFRHTPEGLLLSPSRPPYDRFPYGLVSPMDAYARGLQKIMTPPPLTSEFMGMASYSPTCFLDIMDNDVGSDGSSIGDVAPSHRPSWECAMTDASGQPPRATESSRTYAPPGPHTKTSELTREHEEELQR